MHGRSSPLSALSTGYLEELYARYRDAPDQLDESWQCLFGVLDEIGDATGPGPVLGDGVGGGRSDAALIEALRSRAHLLAALDPLAAPGPLPDRSAVGEYVPPSGRSLGELTSLYCGRLTVETAHIDDAGARNWLIAAFEADAAPVPAPERIETLHDLLEADEFERFLARKFPTKKRFGAEGAEAILTLLRQVLRRAAEAGVTHAVIGTMHRGRLNLMANLLGRSPAQLFAEIKGAHPFPADPPRPADVPYHLGHRASVETGAGAVEVLLLANPSHLEAVDPVTLGAARAMQDGPAGGPARVLPIILHTDAAVIGQGVVAETLQLGATEGFGTGGTLHVVINNQIGFTTEQHEARTSRHCTGPWKAIDSAILHANGDDPIAVRRAARIAVEWRQAQGRDAVIDLVCYRRNGHNEIDEPTFTQPVLYEAIGRQEPVAAAEARRVIDEGLATAAEIEAFVEAYRTRLQAEYERAQDFRPNESAYPATTTGQPTRSTTGFDAESLRAIGEELARAPSGLALHPKMDRILRQRVVGESGIAWPTAEALAIGSLMLEGTGVRLTGQDVVRGAFSQRHFGISDARSGARHVGLANLSNRRAPFLVHNSPLSEYAVLGFEYGYSLQRADWLVIWEAQFGDFANGAQIIIDQFVVAGEEKWCAPSGLVLLLPHGLEGQGPEHSSARLERFLQLAAGDNMRIINPSTPANYFHALRRQAHTPTRKPLVVMSPKRLLRLPAAVSPLADFAPGTGFVPLLVSSPGPEITQILLCTGKIAYELEAERDRRDASDVAIVRLEELYPLPAEQLAAVFRRWPRAACTWVQEEPSNMGAWSWLDRQLEQLRQDTATAEPRLRYVGRPAAGSPAGSFHGDHDRHQLAIVEQAFAGNG